MTVVLVFVLGAFGLNATIVAGARGPVVATSTDWPSYLHDPGHSSSTPANAITVANSTNLQRWWHFASPGRTVAGQPGGGFVASPTVYQGSVYIGSNTGVFYALDENTGLVLWSRMLGYVTHKTCAARGIAATATVAVDPNSGAATVYAAGGDGHLYALDAVTGDSVWTSVIATPSTTVNDYYNWSSPTVANGRVYVGVSSQCDAPLVKHSGVLAFDQETGERVATYLSMPAGAIGGSVWTSVAVDPSGAVFATVGNAPARATNKGDSSAIVRLDGASLVRQDKWAIPGAQQVSDNDFDASPTIFVADLGGVPTEMVGACNKNGRFYAFKADDLSSGPVWFRQVGIGTGSGEISCLAAAIWDGSHLFLGGNATTIQGISYAGSMRELDPATGNVIWATGLPGNILGSPSLNGSGVLAASMWASGIQNGTFLIDASDGSVLTFLPSPKAFPQPVFAGVYLLLANQLGVLNAYRPRH